LKVFSIPFNHKQPLFLQHFFSFVLKFIFTNIFCPFLLVYQKKTCYFCAQLQQLSLKGIAPLITFYSAKFPCKFLFLSMKSQTFVCMPGLYGIPVSLI